MTRLYILLAPQRRQAQTSTKLGKLTANVIPTLHLLEACRELNVRRVIFVSSASTVYGIPKLSFPRQKRR